MPYISVTIHYMIVIFGTHVWNDDISKSFIHFFKLLVFQVVCEVKGQKLAQNDKKLCLLCSISQESYIYDRYLGYTSVKWWYFQVFFYFFKILFFQIVRRDKGQKMAQKDKKFVPRVLYISGSIHHMSVIFGTRVLNDDISRYFFHFLKILIFWVFRG